MNPSDLGYSKNMILETQRLMSNPNFMALYNDSVKIQKALGTQNVDTLPKALVSASIDISSALKEINIAHINSFLGHLNQIPNEDFKVIKQTITQNRSEIRDTAKANYETAADIVKKASEGNTDKDLVFSEAVAGLLTDIDNSIKFSKPDQEQKIRVDKSNINTYIGIISLIIALSTLLFSIHQSQSSARSSERQHTESMREEQKQTDLLEQIAEDAVSANNAKQPSEKPPKNKTQQ